MFIDKSDIYIKAGDGGNGCVAFHREKYVAKGGPSGGDGGNGGSVIFEVEKGENTLIKFKYRHKFLAENGENGMTEKFHGKNGADIVIPVPPGTIIRDKATGKILFDISSNGRFVAAKGGRGGWGNKHFATPTRQIPRFARPGLKGGERQLTLELKMLADVGLIGFPNVGKSTLLSLSSSAHPKIADYHFTTLSPVLGVCEYPGGTFVMADIPGLIEGASEGAGLGLEFLRHIDRCRLLVHVVDAAGSEGRDPVSDLKAINEELIKYDPQLINRKQLICANKCDLITEENLSNKNKLAEFCADNGYDLIFVSAYTHDGLDGFIPKIAELLKSTPPMKEYEPELTEESETVSLDSSFTVINENGVYVVEGKKLERIVQSLDIYDRESLSYFEKVIKNDGIIDALEKKGVKEGDTVSVCGFEFEFVY